MKRIRLREDADKNGFFQIQLKVICGNHLICAIKNNKVQFLTKYENSIEELLKLKAYEN